MKTTKHILTLALTLFCALGTTYAIDQTYYTSIDGKSGSTLRDALYTLTAKGPQNMTYNGLWTAYKTTDVYPSDSTDKAGKIWCRVPAAQPEVETDDQPRAFEIFRPRDLLFENQC